MSGAAPSARREIQAFLLGDYPLGVGDEPVEEWSPWGGHEIHQIALGSRRSRSR
jgi:hypothetical protein